MEVQLSNLGAIPGLRLQDALHKLICHKHNANTGNDFVVFWYYSPVEPKKTFLYYDLFENPCQAFLVYQSSSSCTV
jgi:hypothetical protein